MTCPLHVLCLLSGSLSPPYINSNFDYRSHVISETSPSRCEQVSTNFLCRRSHLDASDIVSNCWNWIYLKDTYWTGVATKLRFCASAEKGVCHRRITGSLFLELSLGECVKVGMSTGVDAPTGVIILSSKSSLRIQDVTLFTFLVIENRPFEKSWIW